MRVLTYEILEPVNGSVVTLRCALVAFFVCVNLCHGCVDLYHTQVRLHEGDNRRLGRDREDRRQQLPQRDERGIDHHQVDWPTDVFLAERPRVRTLVDSDARVLAQLGMELAVPHVDRDDVLRAMLQQAVGKASG